MKSLRELYKVGRGPSSSHTMGPSKAAGIYAAKHPEAKGFQVTLYGSLSATGKGHLTDVAINDALSKVAPVEIIWSNEFLDFHPNAMKFAVKADDGSLQDEWTVYSVGGGALSEGDASADALSTTPEVYSLNSMKEIQAWCDANGRTFWEYVEECEGPQIWDYLADIWKVMQQAVEDGLQNEGVLPGPIHLQRKATIYFVKANGYKPSLQSRGLVHAYALAVSEQNASGGTIVTAPTCGSSGVMPAVMYHMKHGHDFSDLRILRALATGGLFGNLVKQNASISGADVGCQGEVGVACAMAAAAVCQLFGGTTTQIEYAAEMGLEHHLGMTCDPVCGLVQVPCIERNAFAATRALDANFYAMLSDGRHIVSFDDVVSVMKQTGHDLPNLYKETGIGGLAASYKK